MTSDVAQGSVLGPLLFCYASMTFPLYVVSHSKVKLFADDVTVYIFCSNDVSLLQLDLSKYLSEQRNGFSV